MDLVTLVTTLLILLLNLTPVTGVPQMRPPPPPGRTNLLARVSPATGLSHDPSKTTNTSVIFYTSPDYQKSSGLI